MKHVSILCGVKQSVFSVISGFRRSINKIAMFFGFDAAYNVISFLLTFRNNLLVASSRVKQSSIGCPAMSVRNYDSALRKVPKEHRYQSVLTLMQVVHTCIVTIGIQIMKILQHQIKQLNKM